MNYVTLKEAIKILNITSSILYKLKKTGKINFKYKENNKKDILYDVDSAIIEEPEDGKLCPFCGMRLNNHNGRHIYSCNKRDMSLTKDDIKLKFLEFNYGKEILENICKDYKQLYSLPMLKEKYNIDYKSILFLVKLNGIQLRSYSESAKQISQEKYKKTCLEKYGVDNVSKSEDIKKKKADTFTEHYGVDNIWKTAGYNKKVAELHPESHQEHMRKLHEGSRNYFDNRTKDEILSTKEKRRKTLLEKNQYDSKLETRFCKILNMLFISYTRQFHIKGHGKKSFHAYDFYLVDSNIIIEINGDFWHMNPLYYKEDDVNGANKKTAKEIWERDKMFEQFANDCGYYIIKIWENEMNKMSDE